MRFRHLVAAALASSAVLGAGAAPAHAAGFKFFHSPSGNIRCMLTNFEGWSARCDITSHTYRAPRRPAACEGDWGDSLSMGARTRARFLCHGDAVDMGTRLAYGRSITYGPFTCTSRRDGMVCKNAKRHGWRLAKESYRLV